ncbi:MAG: tetratricopeptide repeat protein, partial [Pirellulaceae bacterium]|nr:tetratricopeptide repeat protein [Pirellulaceae bacterium]
MPEGPRRVIGPYKLLEQIGEGGMGVVYMAEQIEPVERQVAMKIIKPGMDSRQVIARFEAEEQALAMMDHPNIAKVFEGGTTDSGQPYFVMELIQGIPITRYCDEHHLTPRQRLDLFVPVCHAVQHAHQKGIIHRDIKPSNVLVAEYDDRPVPKIIDFGVAKATEQRLTERTVFTPFGQVVGTLEYMSPEQAGLNQLDIDTRSDIYSLGVLLYELLTGERPFDRQRLRSAAFDEMLRIIREEEPPKPSTRLSTSESLPSIAANRHTEPKKLSTLVRGELDWIVMKALEKDRTRRYETANGFANDIQRYLNDEPVLACPPSAAYRLKKFARRNKATLTIVSVAALVLVAVAIGAGVAAVRFRDLAQRNAVLAAEKQAALTSAIAAEQAATTARDREAAQREEAQRQTQLAKDALADVEREQQRAEGNLDLAMEALDLIYVWSIGRNRLLGKPISRPAELEPLTTDERPLFSDLERTLLKRGLGFYDAFARRNATAPRASLRTAQAYLWIGLISGALGDPAAAAEAYHGAIERFEQLTKEEPGNAEHFRQLAETYRGLADVAPQWEAAKQWSEKSRQAYSRAIELKPDDILAYLGRATILERLDRAKAVTDYEKALQLDPQNIDALLACAHVYEKTRGREYAERAVALAPDNPKCHVELAEKLSTENCTWIGPGRMICPDPEPALEHYARAIELAPASPRGYRARGKFYRRIDDNERALADLNRALELDPSDRWAIKNRGIVLARLSQFDKALADLARHMQIYPHDVDVQRQILDIHLATNNWESAVESITGILEYDPPDSEKLRELRIEGYLSLGRDDEALADCDRCVELKPDKARPVMIRAELLATAGRIEEYRRACSDIFKRFSQSGDEWDLYHAARACVILPQAVPDPTEPVKLAT